MIYSAVYGAPGMLGRNLDGKNHLPLPRTRIACPWKSQLCCGLTSWGNPERLPVGPVGVLVRRSAIICTR